MANTQQNGSIYIRVMNALQCIGIDYADFSISKRMYVNRSDRAMHRHSHIYRVMIGCALLGQTLNKPRLGLLAFIGAYVHDLGRINDGGDRYHGWRSAEFVLPKQRTILDTYNISDEEYDMIYKAVVNHSADKYKLTDDALLVANILHDADALDRCRFNDPHAKLNQRFLQLSQSKDFIKIIEDICDGSRNEHLIEEEVPFNEFVEKSCKKKVDEELLQTYLQNNPLLGSENVLYRVKEGWLMNLKNPYNGEIPIEWKNKIIDVAMYQTATLYPINKSFIGAIFVLGNGCGKGLFVIYDTFGMQGGTYLSRDENPFMYSDIKVYRSDDWSDFTVDLNKSTSYGYAACKQSNGWKLVKVIQFPNFGYEVLGEGFASAEDAMKSIGIEDSEKYLFEGSER